MSENVRKRLSLLIAVALLFTMFPVHAAAQEQTVTEPAVSELPVLAAPDMPDTLNSDGAVLELGVPTDVTVLPGETEAYLVFTPTETGVYQFTAISDIDTCGVLYLVSENGLIELERDDDSGANGNFMMNVSLEAGFTYQINAYQYGGGACSFQLLVEATQGIQSVTFTPVSVMENTHGYIVDEWDEETQTYVEYYCYDVFNLLHESTYTVTLDDGTVLSGSGSGFGHNDRWYSFKYSSNQSVSNPWTAGNTYYIDVSVMDYTAQLQITIEASPVANVTFTPVSAVEKTDGYITDGWNEATGTYEEYYHYSGSSLLRRTTHTITFTDGSVISGSDDGCEYNGQWYYFEYSSNQSASNPWMAGNTYDLDVTVMGKTVQLPVTIEKSPIVSMTFTPVSVMANSDGYTTESWNEETGTYEEYFCYSCDSLLQKSTYSITFTDGTVLTGSGGGFEYNGQWYYFEYSSNQSASNPWMAGNTYDLAVTVMGKTVQLPVTIEKSPLVSLTFTPVSVVENTEGYIAEGWNEETGSYEQCYFYPEDSLIRKSTYTVTLTDGTVLTGTDSGFEYNGQWYSFSCSSNQSASNPWTEGNTYHLDITVMGQTVQLPVIIEGSPIASLTFTSVSVTEYTNGHRTEDWDEESGTYMEYFYYYEYNLLNRSTYTVTFTDGTVLTGSGSDFEYNGEWYSFYCNSDQSGITPWLVGNTYYMDVTVMGQTGQLPVIIEGTPIVSVTFEPIIVEDNENGGWVQSSDGRYFRYNWQSLLRYTVTFADGTVRQANYYDNLEYNGVWYYCTDYSDNQSDTDPWLAGNTYTAQVTFAGQNYDVVVSVVQSVEDNGFLYLVQDGKAIITDCTTTGEILAIPEMIDGYPVAGIASLGEALEYAYELRIPDSVTMLSANALKNQYSSVEKLVLGSGISEISEEMLSEAWYLKQIEVVEDNPYFCSIDGVLYDKEVTTLVAYPPMKQEKCIVPDSVTSLNIDLTHPMYTNVDIQFGTGITEYKIVDGVIYNADMTTVIRCTDEATGSYTMPETVTEISRYAFQHSNLTSVTLSSNVTEIVYGAFYCSALLEEITIPESVTVIDEVAFFGCDNLEKAHIPSIEYWCDLEGTEELLPVAHNLYVDGGLIKDLVVPDTANSLHEYLFMGGSFETVSIPPSVQTVGYNAFADCQNLKKVYITDLAAWCSIYFENAEANPLYHMEDLYLNGELVTDMVIPDGVEEIGMYAFYNGSMERVTVPSSVKRIGYQAFYEASVKTVSLAEGLTNIQREAFQRSALRSVELPDSLTYLEPNAFFECTDLESVDIGGGLTYIDDNTFCKTGLKSVTIPKQVTVICDKAFAFTPLTQVQFDCDEVEIRYKAFQHCPLKDLEFGDNVTWIGDNAFEDAEAAEVILPPSVTCITYRSFAFNPNLVSVTIADTVTEIDTYAFERDINLSHVLYTGTQDQWNALDVQSVELNQATLHCEALGNEVTTKQTCTHVQFFCTICNKWETARKMHANHTFENDVCTICGQEGYWEYVVDENAGAVTVIGYVGNDADVVIPDELEGLPVKAFTAEIFAYSRKLNSVTIPGTVTEIPSGAFRECKYLEKVTVESGVTAIGSYAFYECRNLEELTLPDTVTTVEEYAFYKNFMAKFRLPQGLTTVGDYAFYNCGRLYDGNIPQGVTTVGEHAFHGCYGFGEVIIPRSLTEISPYAFAKCYMDKLQLPETLITIGEYAFEDHSLTVLEIPASVETIGEGAFHDYYDTIQTLKFLGAKPAMEDALKGKCTGFYHSDCAGWEEYLASYEGEIIWYAANGPEIRVQPESVTVESGSVATVRTEGYGHRLRYQWYCAPYGSDTFTAVGGNCFELSMVMDETNHNVRAYCVITDTLGRTVTTQTVVLKIGAEPVGIRIDRMPDTVEYDLHQQLRTDGLEVVLVYPGFTVPIEDYTVSGYRPDVAGVQTVTVSYGSHTATFNVTVIDTSVPDYVPGDVSGDGKINIMDVVKLYAHVKGVNTMQDETALKAADYTGDGKINIMDIAKLYATVKG